MGKIAFVFSGQGAQYPGMGRELCEVSLAAREVFDIAQSIRADIKELCFEGTKEQLTQTVNTQPCLFCTDLAAAESLREQGLVPDFVAGFSLGEIPALAFGGALSHEDAFRLVCRRGQLMEQASSEHQGVMAAVLGLSPERVRELCSKIPGLYPVNFNCQTQTVAAFTENIAQQVTALFTEAGAKLVRLGVSGAFHSPYMESAAKGMAEYVADMSFEQPSIPVYSNVTAEPITCKELIAEQVSSPVLWQRTVENMIAQGADIFIEVGAGKTLCGLIKKIDPGVTVYNVENKSTLEAVLEAVKC